MSSSKFILIALAVCLFAACTPQPKEKVEMKEKVYTKKYTNADYYKDGKIQPEVVKKAYLEMLESYGVPFSKTLQAGIWMTDFNLGDFEHVGMAGIFWVNDSTHKYFGHEIYLLPGQMIVEHKHVATTFPAKFESWQVRHGWAYNYSIGETTPNAPELPASQKDHITISHFQKQMVDEVIHLAEIESPHFLLAGDNGAIISEFATYHDGAGLRFTNPKVVFTDILTQK